MTVKSKAKSKAKPKAKAKVELKGKLMLPAKMEMGALADVYKEMKASAAKNHKEYVLDGGDISLIDSAGVQLIVSFIRLMTGAGCDVSWENYSVQVYQVADELGVSDQLGD